MKTVRILGTIALTGAILTLGPVGSATAAGTDATFTIAGGSLDVTAAATATLTGATPGAASVSGLLGDVGVSDTRGSEAGWTVSASSTEFTSLSDTTTSTSTGVSYNSGEGTPGTGTVTPNSAGLTSIVTNAEVATGTAAMGNNTATYSPTLTVSLPSDALAGTYAGTVTTSVA